MKKNKEWMREEESTSSENPIYSTLTSITNVNGTKYVLVCLRGVGGRDYGKIYTQGGSIDLGETPEEAAIREAYEESGLTVSLDELRLTCLTEKFAHYHVIFNDFPVVLGPESHHRWEVIQTNDLERRFGVPMIYDCNKRCTGLTWVEADRLYEEIKDMDYNVSKLFKIMKKLNII
jgi:8-oxo-dGTP pyrophosphatase MutT (NUDIX family)